MKLPISKPNSANYNAQKKKTKKKTLTNTNNYYSHATNGRRRRKYDFVVFDFQFNWLERRSRINNIFQLSIENETWTRKCKEKPVCRQQINYTRKKWILATEKSVFTHRSNASKHTHTHAIVAAEKKTTFPFSVRCSRLKTPIKTTFRFNLQQ